MGSSIRSLADENWYVYYKGNSFECWNGPSPPSGHPKYAAVKADLKKVFHSYNIISEAVTHYVNALVGKPFHWYLTSDGKPVEGETETEELLQNWWNWQQKVNIANALSFGKGKPLSAAIAQMLVRDKGDGIGVGYLRLYSPKRYANLEPWKRFVLHSPAPGTVMTERDTDNILYRATYQHNGGKEVYTLLDNGKTQIEIEDRDPITMDLGGKLPIFELNEHCIISPDVKQVQNAINKTLTLKDMNLNYAGFLERVILNGQMPGKWVLDPTAPGGERFVSEPNGLEMGANKITYIEGKPIGDPRNPSGWTNPEISYRDPVAVTNFAESLNIDISHFYMSVGLGHLLSAGDGSLSGRSRETIKQDWVTRLEGYAETIEMVLGDVFSTVLLLMAGATNDVRLTTYTPVVQLNLATNNPLPEERKENREDFNAGLLSRTTAMVRAGIDDPDAEWELVKRERSEDLEMMARQPSFVEEFSENGN